MVVQEMDTGLYLFQFRHRFTYNYADILCLKHLVSRQLVTRMCNWTNWPIYILCTDLLVNYVRRLYLWFCKRHISVST